MKVLKNNFNNTTNKEIKQEESYPRKLICENCGSELEYEKSDLRMGVLGCMFVDCPLCGRNNMLEDNEESITLTMDNVEFPVHFFHTSKENGAVDICNNEEIKKRIQEAITCFRKDKEVYSWHSESGNLYIQVRKYDGDETYAVIVSNNFYSTEIPFEPQDY